MIDEDHISELRSETSRPAAKLMAKGVSKEVDQVTRVKHFPQALIAPVLLQLRRPRSCMGLGANKPLLMGPPLGPSVVTSCCCNCSKGVCLHTLWLQR